MSRESGEVYCERLDSTPYLPMNHSVLCRITLLMVKYKFYLNLFQTNFTLLTRSTTQLKASMKGGFCARIIVDLGNPKRSKQRFCQFRNTPHVSTLSL